MSKVGLVLGAGGTVGMAYHAGVLHALHEVGGFAAEDADLVVGTSAGSVVGAYLRSGWTTDDFWQLALGTHPELEALTGGAPNGHAILTPNFRTPLDLWRRVMGSAFVMGRSALRLPGPRLPKVLQRAFPAGMFAMHEGRRRFTAELPDQWPERDLWLCAVDLFSGRRVVLGRGHRAATTSLRDAVMASCAIPGVYPPVRIGPLTLVDGGAASSTNLDLAGRAGCDLVIASVPMAFDPTDPPGPFGQLLRRIPARAVASEAASTRRHGATVLLLRPSAAEIWAHGVDMMRGEGLDQVARAAYESTARTLDTPRFRDALGATVA